MLVRILPPPQKRNDMFDKSERSTFKYWFAHWCAFQLTALRLRAWRFKYLFHDIEKPWLRILFRGDYAKVQKWHRRHNNHHLQYPGKKDYIAMVLDWECSQLTKTSSPYTAYGWYLKKKHEVSDYDNREIEKALKELNLWEK